MKKEELCYYLRYLAELAEDVLFPPRCVVCDELLGPHDRRVHARCREKLIPVGDVVCMHCGRPVSREGDSFCPPCLRSFAAGIQGNRAADQGKAVFIYEGAIKITMYRFKYSNRREYVHCFGEAAVAGYGKWIRNNQVQCIVPIPMYPRKRRKRGYNQAEVFGRELAVLCGLPLERSLLYRKKNTRPLKLFNETERRKELQGAFYANEKRCREKAYESVLLVDDIYTTGATVNTAAEILKAAGVKKVFVLTVCTSKIAT